MSDIQGRRTDAEIEAVLSDVEAGDLELLEPPDEVWAAIESATAGDSDATGAVVSLASRRWTPRRLALGVAAVLVLVVAGAAAVVLTRDDPADVVATAALAYDSENFDTLGSEASASAELVVEAGSHSIVIVDAMLPSPEAGSDLEVWLLRPDAEGNVVDLVSLGVVDPADPGSLEVPSGYDPDTFFVVDISVEPRDGDAGHSGRSILRGSLLDA